MNEQQMEKEVGNLDAEIEKLNAEMEKSKNETKAKIERLTQRRDVVSRNLQATRAGFGDLIRPIGIEPTSKVGTPGAGKRK